MHQRHGRHLHPEIRKKQAPTGKGAWNWRPSFLADPIPATRESLSDKRHAHRTLVKDYCQFLSLVCGRTERMERRERATTVFEGVGYVGNDFTQVQWFSLAGAG